MWLLVSKPVPDGGWEVDHWWSVYLRRFDLEHTRIAALDLLRGFGTPLRAASTHASGDDGELVLDAYLTPLMIGTPATPRTPQSG